MRILRLYALEDPSGETVTRMYSEDLGRDPKEVRLYSELLSRN